MANPLRDISVFINCPFDAEYEPLFDALIFTTLCCGFLPRTTTESGTAAVARMDRIHSAILDSKYSIHDLSRCQGEGELNLARFNMPLELGMAMSQALADPNTHEWFVLTLADHESSRYISDLMGFDLKRHNGTIETLIPPVMAWLLTRQEAVGELTPHHVITAFAKFETAVRELRIVWLKEVPWPTLLRTAQSFIPTFD